MPNNPNSGKPSGIVGYLPKNSFNDDPSFYNEPPEKRNKIDINIKK